MLKMPSRVGLLLHKEPECLGLRVSRKVRTGRLVASPCGHEAAAKQKSEYEKHNYLFRRKAFGLSPYWPTNAELLPYGSFVARDTLRGKLFPSSFFPQLLSVGSVSTATGPKSVRQ